MHFFAVLFCKILRKKSIVVAGGDDVAYLPEIKYGMFSYWWKKWCPLFVFRHADLVLTVSKFNESETLKNTKALYKKVKMIYHGFRAEKFKIPKDIKKDKIVLTVSSISNERIKVKGLDLFIQTAVLLPETGFLLVGTDKDKASIILKKSSGKNVTFLGEVTGRDLLNIYLKAKVYVQLSIHESFGCALAEAMLCECIPVVSKTGATPEVVGDCGFYVDILNPETIAEKIKEALEATDELGKRARERIIKMFPLEKRKNELITSINELLKE